ncbi:glycosyltransferase family 2 protein [bacterium]|nr:glycosyltransferase family 2 protein [bacterium]
MNNPKVSIISPCYNGQNHLGYFFESLLTQDYSGQVEFIFVDDGSTDNTKNIFEQYKLALEKKGWDVIYIYQENQGQAASLNQGLKIFSGDYLLWPDSDDILYSNHITEKVKYMEEHKEVGLAYCLLDRVFFDDTDKIIGQDLRGRNTKDAFKNIMHDKDVIWCPIGVVLRSSAFLDAYPQRQIPTCKNCGSQNCQMQLPILHKYPCGYIDKPLGKYVIRANSTSRSYVSFYKRRLLLCKIWIITILTLKDANIFEKVWLIIYSVLNNLCKMFRHFIKSKKK